MKSIVRAMVPLLQVLILTMFVIVIYATVGLSFLVNKFHKTCFNKKGKKSSLRERKRMVRMGEKDKEGKEKRKQKLITLYRYSFSCLGEMIALGETIQPCDTETKGMFTGRGCNRFNNETCREYWVGPNEGISTYDNILLAILTVSQCITMEGWTDIMYSVGMNDSFISSKLFFLEVQ